MADLAPETPTTPPLLETKLYEPRVRSRLVTRQRLIDQLDAAAHQKLALICAPAGFGKTTLVAEWLAASSSDEWGSAWVSLDQADNDLAQFWSYITAALRKVDPSIGSGLVSLLSSPQTPPIESILTMLINEVVASGRDIVLVLDDFHFIDAKNIHDSISFFIDHLPPRLQLVITSRADPPLPLGRLRARGEMTEIRAADLKFTSEGVADFLNVTMGLELAARDVERLDSRIEGWIAGLQLAALSIRGRDNHSEFIASFAGNDRYLVDYLVEEVLERQPETVRAFLLDTAILDRLNADLCDSVRDTIGSQEILESLERDNLFVIPLDDERRWYRFHRLFSDVLRTRKVPSRRGCC